MTAGPALGRQMRDLVVGAAEFEAEDRLQILALQQDLRTHAGRQQRRGLERRLAGDVIDPTGQNLAQQALDEGVWGRRRHRASCYHPSRMPIYEYKCRECRDDFELLVHASTTPVCPSCESTSLQRRLSAFAVGRGGSMASAPAPRACGACGDPRGAGSCSMN
jgi:putative FmdB family regulatory protein